MDQITNFESIPSVNSVIVFNKLSDDIFKDKYDKICCDANLLLESAAQASYDFNRECTSDGENYYFLFNFFPTFYKESKAVVKTYDDCNCSELYEKTKDYISEFIQEYGAYNNVTYSDGKYLVPFKDAFLFALIFMFHYGKKADKTARFNPQASCGERSYRQVLGSLISFLRTTAIKDVKTKVLINKLIKEQKHITDEVTDYNLRLNQLEKITAKSERLKSQSLKGIDKLYLMYQVEKIDQTFNFFKAFYMSERAPLFLSESIHILLRKNLFLSDKEINTYKTILKEKVFENSEFINLCFNAKHPDPFFVLFEYIERFLKSGTIDPQIIDEYVTKDAIYYSHLDIYDNLKIDYFTLEEFLGICITLTESDIKNYEKNATEKLNEFKELKTIDITKFSQNSDEGKTIQSCWFDHYFGAFEKLESYIKKPNKIEHKYLYFYFEKAREFAAQKCFPKGK